MMIALNTDLQRISVLWFFSSCVWSFSSSLFSVELLMMEVHGVKLTVFCLLGSSVSANSPRRWFRLSAGSAALVSLQLLFSHTFISPSFSGFSSILLLPSCYTLFRLMFPMGKVFFLNTGWGVFLASFLKNEVEKLLASAFSWLWYREICLVFWDAP